MTMNLTVAIAMVTVAHALRSVDLDLTSHHC